MLLCIHGIIDHSPDGPITLILYNFWVITDFWAYIIKAGAIDLNYYDMSKKIKLSKLEI